MYILGRAPGHTEYSELTEAQQIQVKLWWRAVGNKTDERNRAAYRYEFRDGEVYSAT